MERSDAYWKLTTMLKEAGLSPDALDLEKTWEVFIAFCEIPLTDAESDGVLVQWGPVREGRSIMGEVIGFYFSVLRQWNDDYEEFDQLELEWVYPISDYTKNLKGNSWSGFSHPDKKIVGDAPNFLRQQRESDLFHYLKTQTPIKTEMTLDNTG